MSIAQVLGEPQYPLASGRLCLHELVSRQSERTPDAVALDNGTRTMTYRSLEEQANRLAHVLRNHGVGPEVVVGLAIKQGQDGLESLVALFGVLKAGGAVLTLSGFYPPAQLRWMIADAGVGLILAVQRREASRIAEINTDKRVGIISLDDPTIQQELAEQPRTPPTGEVTPGTLAYVIYTSGSTGQPKGVLCTHQHLQPLAEAFGRLFEVKVGDRHSQLFNWQFDGFFSEIVTALGNGATLCLPPSQVLASGANAVAWLERERIVFAHATPSFLATWPDVELPLLQALVIAGEPCPEELAKRHVQKKRSVYLAYGPAETGICLTAYRYGGQGTPTMGFPLPYVRLLLLDEAQQVVASGKVGEVVALRPVMRGYTSRDETARRFRPYGEERAYFTGDLARQAPDGSLEWMGRSDNQVKLPGGVTANLAQIEAVVGAHPGVLTCKALLRDERWIATYIVLKQRGQFSMQQLRDYLHEWLLAPIASRCVCVELDALPLTPNGKAATTAAAYPALTVDDFADRVGEFRQPCTPTETALAELIIAVMTRGLISKEPASINVLQTPQELLFDSMLVGELEEQIIARWSVVLSDEQVRWQLWRIAEFLAGGRAPLPVREGH